MRQTRVAKNAGLSDVTARNATLDQKRTAVVDLLHVARAATPDWHTSINPSQLALRSSNGHAIHTETLNHPKLISEPCHEPSRETEEEARDEVYQTKGSPSSSSALSRALLASTNPQPTLQLTDSPRSPRESEVRQGLLHSFLGILIFFIFIFFIFYFYFLFCERGDLFGGHLACVSAAE